MHRSNIVNKKESVGVAAAMDNIDCGSREACSVEEREEAPQENASFFFRTVL